jgi:hypothetical protein
MRREKRLASIKQEEMYKGENKTKRKKRKNTEPSNHAATIMKQKQLVLHRPQLISDPD